ncbi:MAG: histone deacetylase [Thermoplasmata archaeon]|nr:histone deacetylase [Thermoplasmata archaeon]
MKIVYSEEYLKHRHAGYHPERPERLVSIREALKGVSIWEEHLLTPGAVDLRHLKEVHSEGHIARIREFGVGWMDPDTYHDERTYEIALLASGGAVAAALHTYDKKEPTLALLRPPGHHAGRDYNGGFCYFNNIAVAARALQMERGVKRVAIVDVDVHHGNGTHDIFLSDPTVLYISTHQWGIYPGTGPLEEVGRGDGEGYTVNLPLYSGHGDGTFRMLMDEIILPILREFSPGALLVSLGLDAHYMDPLASLTLSSPAYVELLLKLKEAADDLSEGRISYMLEGGYNLDALAEVFRGLALHLTGRGEEAEYRYSDVSDPGDGGRVKRLKEEHGKYWKI